jgi:hypothetical protein
MMPIEREPFRKYNLTKEKDDKFTVKLGKDFSREMLEKAKTILEQERDSTTMKQLAMIGYAKVILDPETHALLGVLFKNKRTNRRNGIVTFDPLG